MALRLRYSDRSIVLPAGQLFVGRSGECHIVVDDPLASRRHAVITMGKSGAMVTDLASKLGVRVNGSTIAGAARLGRGDTILIASLEIVVEEVRTEDEPTDPRLRATLAPPPSSGSPMRLRPTPPLGIPRVDARMATDTIDDGDDDFDHHGAMTRTQEAPRVSLPPDLGRGPISSSRSPDLGSARISALPPLPSFPRSGALGAIAGVGEKALALGRADEAERILQRALQDTLECARRGEIDAPTAELAASLAARLAAATGATRWFDFVVTLYSVRVEVAPAPVIDLLYAAAGKLKGPNKAQFRQYVAILRSVPNETPARRFLMQRLEGLQRLVDLK